MGSQRVGHDWATFTFTLFQGDPCRCLILLPKWRVFKNTLNIPLWVCTTDSWSIHVDGLLGCRILAIQREQNWVCFGEVEKCRVCHKEERKAKREKQISNIKAYIWNTERWSWWIYLLGRNTDAYTENRPVDREGEGERGTNWESSTELYTPPRVK